MPLGILFSQENGSIRFWKVVNCCQFFSLSTSDIHQLERVDCIQTHPDGRGRHWAENKLQEAGTHKLPL